MPKSATSWLSPELLHQTLPQCKDPAGWAKALQPALEKYQINTPSRIAAFLAQTGYESGHFNQLQENLRYSTPQRLMKVWPKRFPTIESALPYVQNPERLANKVYALRMGNGPESSGDGYRYRGRGIIQLTGRSNYAEAAKALGIDLLGQPDGLLEPHHAAMSAAWFWSTHGLNALADDETGDDDLEDFTQITRRINGGARLKGHPL